MKRPLCLFATALALAGPAAGAIPPAEKLLPADTLLVLTVPDFNKTREIYTNSPQSQLWNDPSMKAFKDKFVEKFKADIVTPLERELGIKFADFYGLAQGQLTVALVQNGWQGGNDPKPAPLLLLDTRDKSETLKKQLADIKQKWVEAGKPYKSEKIRDTEFSVLITTEADIGKTLGKVLPGFSANQPAEQGESAEKKTADKKQIYLGQVESLLILGNDPKVIEKVLVRLSGGLVPALGEQAAYEANHNAMFRDAPFYGWANASTLVEIFNRKAAENSESSEPSLVPIRMDKVLGATGLTGLKTIAFSYRNAPEGGAFHLLLGVPEAARQGIFQILAAEAKDANPPPFVPAGVIKFQRWRADGQKAWATLEKMLTDISPQMFGGVKFMLDTAEAAAKEKDPGFDLRKNLIGNLGDDIITYQKPPRDNTVEQLGSPPTLYLIGSPNADQLAGALKSVLVLASGAGGAPDEREFLGRKIYSFKLPSTPGPASSPRPARSINYAGSGGYVAVTTDVALLEEYLRSSESTGKTLRDTAGLAEAAQKVGGTGTGFFAYANQSETMKASLEVLKRGGVGSDSMLAFALQPRALAEGESQLKEWADFSLLPEFSKIARYFHFSVSSWNAAADGLHMKMFAPTPPELRK